MSRGILVGTDQTLAWLLPWWWKHYSRFNRYPVIFVDFGLSDEAVAWCRERGEVVKLHLDRSFIASKADVCPDLAADWEHLYGKNVWEARQGWFCKPFAMLLSSFETTLWMDLDCEVRGSLEPLFDHLHPASDMSLISDPEREKIYNSGVVLFRKHSRLLKEWAEQCLGKSDQCLGDDYVLSPLIESGAYSFQELPKEYHWMMRGELNLSALILHWAGNWGKLFIETHGSLNEYRNKL
jgi:hypothetical protein